MKKIKIIIVDDHKIFRNGLKLLLNGIDNVEVIAEASNGKEFLIIVEKNKPDIVFMDISMPVMDGIQATQKALEKNPELKIIALTTFGDENYLQKMIEVGVVGFLIKNAEKEEFEKALKMVIEGNNYFSSELLIRLTKKILDYKRIDKPKEENSDKFNNREIEITKLISKGYSNQEIADTIYLSRRTIEGYRSKLLEKTETKNSVELVIYAIKNKIIEI